MPMTTGTPTSRKLCKRGRPLADPRKCGRCRKRKPLNEENFYPNSDGYTYICIACNNDDTFERSMRRLLKRSSTEAVQEKLHDLQRRARLIRKVLNEASK